MELTEDEQLVVNVLSIVESDHLMAWAEIAHAAKQVLAERGVLVQNHELMMVLSASSIACMIGVPGMPEMTIESVCARVIELAKALHSLAEKGVAEKVGIIATEKKPAKPRGQA